MKERVIQLAFGMLLTLMLSACAHNVPLHTEPNSLGSLSHYTEVPTKSFLKLKPFSDGTPQYRAKIFIGRRVGNLSGVVYEDYLYAKTNGDTVGLELLEDGSSTYDLVVAEYKGNDGSGHLITSVKSEMIKLAKQREIEMEKEIVTVARDQEIKMARAALREKHCKDLNRNGFFCFDDNAKLANHDVKVISSLLSDLTHKMVINTNNGSYLSVDSPKVVGQWFIESATDKSVSITIMMGSNLIGETVIDRLVKAGKTFYIVRENSTKSYK